METTAWKLMKHEAWTKQSMKLINISSMKHGNIKTWYE
jgi:hypothetical protein